MDSVLCEVADRVMTITLNRPEIRNAMDADSMTLVLDFLYRADETAVLAARLAAGPPIAYAQAKRAVNAGLQVDLARGLENEIAGQMVCLESEDKEEGVRAWKEKRPPRFEGR